MLTWNTNNTNDRISYTAVITDPNEYQVKIAIEKSADKAIGLLKDTIQDDSLYLLFEWDINTASLTVVVTDASKTHDSTESIRCICSGVQSKFSQADETQRLEYADTIKFWLHDYLTTCTAFFSYSLVAIFHSSTRKNTELL